MSSLPDHRALGRFAAFLMLGAVAFTPGQAAAQGIFPSIGFAPLPSFAWPQPGEPEQSRWAGSYTQMSTGFQVTSSKRFGSYSGPTIGFEGGRMWQEGNLIYGVSGGFDYMAALGGSPTPRFGGLAYSRDFAGALQVKVGTLLTPDVLLYTKVGAIAAHEKLRFGATSSSLPFSRDDIVLRPDARVGVEWAVTDRLSVSLEAGVVGRGLAD